MVVRRTIHYLDDAHRLDTWAFSSAAMRASAAGRGQSAGRLEEGRNAWGEGERRRVKRGTIVALSFQIVGKIQGGGKDSRARNQIFRSSGWPKRRRKRRRMVPGAGAGDEVDGAEPLFGGAAAFSSRTAAAFEG